MGDYDCFWYLRDVEEDTDDPSGDTERTEQPCESVLDVDSSQREVQR